MPPWAGSSPATGPACCPDPFRCPIPGRAATRGTLNWKPDAVLTGDRAGDRGGFTARGGVIRWKLGADGTGEIIRVLNTGPGMGRPHPRVG